jgi:hypothetical protein
VPLTSRRPRPLDRTIPHLRETRLIVIATEGASTEKEDFTIFRNTRRNSRVQVLVLPTIEGHSSPKHVFTRLAKMKREHDLRAVDQLWVMIDVDRWPTKMLAEVARAAKQKGFPMAVSNPCFELWLYLHHSDVEARRRYTSREMKDELARISGGYDPSNLQIERFESNVDDAVRRATALDVRPRQRWPHSTGTHVYRAVNEILKLGRQA